MSDDKQSTTERAEEKKINEGLSAPAYIPPEDGDNIWELVKTALLAVMLALIIRTFAFEPFNIPSGSMLPTLKVGDYLFVSKYSYGYGQYSFPFGIVNFDGRIASKTPQRGDVAVFRQPKRPEIDYIKRIIGLPGDRIQVKEGILYINGASVLREHRGIEQIDNVFGRATNYTEYNEVLPNGVQHSIIEFSDEGQYDNTPVYTVPVGHFFAMGDNRDSSQDSRATAQVGFVPMDNLIGRAEFIFFSTDGSAKLHEIWKWPSAVRFDRILKPIQ